MYFDELMHLAHPPWFHSFPTDFLEWTLLLLLPHVVGNVAANGKIGAGCGGGGITHFWRSVSPNTEPLWWLAAGWFRLNLPLARLCIKRRCVVSIARTTTDVMSCVDIRFATIIVAAIRLDAPSCVAIIGLHAIPNRLCIWLLHVTVPLVAWSNGNVDTARHDKHMPNWVCWSCCFKVSLSHKNAVCMSSIAANHKANWALGMLEFRTVII